MEYFILLILKIKFRSSLTKANKFHLLQFSWVDCTCSGLDWCIVFPARLLHFSTIFSKRLMKEKFYLCMHYKIFMHTENNRSKKNNFFQLNLIILSYCSRLNLMNSQQWRHRIGINESLLIKIKTFENRILARNV